LIPGGETAIRSQGAKVALVEFADYECHYCAVYEREVFPIIKREFIDTGQITYVYLDYPIEKLHPLALKASVAAECARSQGKYWEMHEELFRGLGGQRTLDPVAIAQRASLQPQAFERCFKAEPLAKIRADQAWGRKLGVTGTPTFFIGLLEAGGQINVKRSFAGAQRVEVFRQEINRVLGQALERRP
jgi:protein-disulfide isomerase